MQGSGIHIIASALGVEGNLSQKIWTPRKGSLWKILNLDVAESRLNLLVTWVT